eukprot:comp152798_c0_seq1/m.49391 comp152798_c0_seq1/g.49391  ORF comp152798_c0_seq1/g.49391 comp152798_c0_seq1/m.49391 type:complete len:154 (-) comp152798_c0_seq1:325-786(-)
MKTPDLGLMRKLGLSQALRRTKTSPSTITASKTARSRSGSTSSSSSAGSVASILPPISETGSDLMFDTWNTTTPARRGSVDTCYTSLPQITDTLCVVCFDVWGPEAPEGLCRHKDGNGLTLQRTRSSSELSLGEGLTEEAHMELEQESAACVW